MGSQIHGPRHERARAKQSQVHEAGKFEKQSQCVHIHNEFQVAPIALSIGRMTWVMNCGWKSRKTGVTVTSKVNSHPPGPRPRPMARPSRLRSMTVPNP